MTMKNNLFKNLMEFCNDESTGAFYKDFIFYGNNYRVFSYRLMPYSVFFEHDDALECRGIMFDLSNTTHPVCRPPKKFFNAHEGNIDYYWDRTILITEKLDGSLISTFGFNDGDGKWQMGVKSKTSVSSDVANLAQSIMKEGRNKDFVRKLEDTTRKNITVNMEITGHDNRIIVDYTNGNELTVLNAIVNTTGEVISHSELVKVFGSEYVVKSINTKNNPSHFITTIPPMKGIEGFVVNVLHNGQETLVKIKTTEYIVKHKLKPRIESPKGLFEAVCLGISDDIKALYDIGSWEIDVIEDMEKFVLKELNKLEQLVEEFYSKNKLLTRKEYAVLGTECFSDSPCGFGCVMKKYTRNGVSIDYQKTMLNSWKYYKNELNDSKLMKEN